jgi:ABC-type glycerol-3-phosphate transport system substrate-binding protein
MKNLIRILLLVALLGIGLAACSGNRRNDRNTDTTSSMSTDSPGNESGTLADSTSKEPGNRSDTSMADTSTKR